MNAFAAQLLDWLFPHTCELCGSKVKDSSYLCLTCEQKFDKPERPLCFQCGSPIHGSVADRSACPHCSGIEYSFDFARACYLNEGSARDLILKLKYEHRIYLGRTLGSLMTHLWEEYADVLAQTDWHLVPVPLHPSKLRQRGYNQAKELAITLAKQKQLPISDILARSKGKSSQTNLSREERFKHTQRLYSIKQSILQEGFIKGKNFLIIDDVFTTGSTVEACAHLLKKEGASRIGVLSLLRSRKLYPHNQS